MPLAWRAVHMMRFLSRSIRSVGLVLALLFAVGAILATTQLTRRSIGLDYYQFWIFAWELRTGEIDDLYSDAAAQAVADKYARLALRGDASPRFMSAAHWNRGMYEHGARPISTPWYYTVFAVPLTGAYDRDLLGFQQITLGLFFSSIVALCLVARYSWLVTALVLGGIGFLFGPLRSDIEAANMNRLQCALVILCVLVWYGWHGRIGSFVGGLILSLGIVFKPNLAMIPLFLLAFWAINRRFEKLVFAALGAVLGGTLAVAVSSAFLGSIESWRRWLEALQKVHADPLPMEHLNLSTARLIHWYTGLDVSSPLTLVLVASFVASVWIGRSLPQPSTDAQSLLEEDLLACGAGCLLPLISSLLAWDHYYVLLIPLVVFLLRPGIEGRLPPGWPAWLPKALIVVAFFLCAQRPVIMLLRPPSVQVLGLYVSVGTSLLWVLLLFEVLRQRRLT